MLLEKIHLEPEENIVKQVRRHWFVIVSQLSSLLLALLLPAVIFMIYIFYAPPELRAQIMPHDYSNAIVFAYGLWALALWTTAFSIWTNYYLDVFTLTNRRVVLINQKGFFRRNVASFRLERLQDMNIEINGLIATLLDYGDLHIETAGHSDEELRATSLPKPREIKGHIAQMADTRISNSTQAQSL